MHEAVAVFLVCQQMLHRALSEAAEDVSGHIKEKKKKFSFMLRFYWALDTGDKIQEERTQMPTCSL